MARHGPTSRSPPRKGRSSKSRSRSSSSSSSRSRSSSPYFKHKRQKRSRSTSSFTSRSRTPRRARKRSPGRKRSYSPRRRASSPRRKSPRKSRSSSPRRRHKRRSRSRSRSTGTSTTVSRRPPPRRSLPKNAPPRKRSPIPKRRSVTPKRRSPSPKRRSPSPKRRTPSPKRRSPSPKRRPVSAKGRSPSTKQRSPSPKRIPTSPQRRSPSPASPRRGQRVESSSPEKPVRPSRPAKKGPAAHRETVSRTPSPQYLGPRGPMPYRRSRSQSPHRMRMMKRPPSSPPRKQGRRSLSPVAKRGRSRSPGLGHGMIHVPSDKMRPKPSGDYSHGHIHPSMRPPLDSEIVHSNIIKPRPRSGDRMYERPMPRRRSFSPPMRAKIRSLSPPYERGPPREYRRVPMSRVPMGATFRSRVPDHYRERYEEPSEQYMDVGVGSAVIFHQGSHFEGRLEKASLSDRFRSKEDKPFIPKENITIGIERNIKGNSPVVFHSEFNPEDVVIVRRKEEGQKPLNARDEFQTDPDDEYTERRVVKVVKSDNEIDRYEEKFQRENFQVRSDRFESSHAGSAGVSLSDRWRLDEDQERRLDARQARSKTSPEVGSSQDVRNGRDSREAHSTRDTRSSKDTRDKQDTRDSRNVRDSRGAQDSRNVRESRNEDSRSVRSRDQRDSRNVADSRTVRDSRTIPDSRSVRDSRNIADSRTVRDSREHDEGRNTVVQDRREIRDSHFESEPSRHREEDERLVTERRRDIVDSTREVSDSRYISREGRDERIVTDRYTVTLTAGDIHAADDRKERYERDPHDLRHNLARRRQGDEQFDARSKIRDTRGRGYERRGRGYDRGRGGYGGYDQRRGGYDRGRGGYDRYNSTSRFSSSTDKEETPNFSKRVDKYKYEEWKDKPEMIPKGVSYFEHDNRDEEDYWQRNRGRGRFRGRSRGNYGYQSGRSRGYYRGRGRGRGYGSYNYHGGFSPEREWVHDKYSDDEADNKPSSTTEK